MTFFIWRVTLSMLFISIICNASYLIDCSVGMGRRFDGIGGLSAGASSKLLANYPETQRNEILDFLFKPNFGASLHILKVEIGGDAQSTDGTESSHMHESWDENYHRGYEWWLMTEAKKRNPAIKLYGLPWAFPGWVGNGSGSPYKFPNVTADYVMRWILAAKKYYQLGIDYIGIWNERPYNVRYVKILKDMLKENNLTANVQVVVADNDWNPAVDVLDDPQFATAVDAIGCHYPGTTTTREALKTGKPLWSSEDYSTNNEGTGAGCWARELVYELSCGATTGCLAVSFLEKWSVTIQPLVFFIPRLVNGECYVSAVSKVVNQNYLNGYMTSTIAWSLIASYYDDLPYPRDGLMTAIEPWSGHYITESPIWVTAHTTQFTQIGWNYLLHGAGVQKLNQGGSFVTFISPDKKDMTIVIETVTHDHSTCVRPDLPPYTVSPQQATFMLNGSLADIEMLYVWETQLYFDGRPSILFQQQSPIKPVLGIFTLILNPDQVYTLTTLATGQHGTFGLPPNSQPFPYPYYDDFEGYAEYTEAFNYSPQSGVWEIRQSNNPSHGKVNRQVVLSNPIYWTNTPPPTVNIGGNYNWSNVGMQADVYIPAINGTDGVFLAARLDRGGSDVASASGIFCFIFPRSGTFKVTADLAKRKLIVNGTCSVKLDTWYTISLSIQDNRIDGFIDSDHLFSATAPSKTRRGFTGYGTATYGYADFDNWRVGPPTRIR